MKKNQKQYYVEFFNHNNFGDDLFVYTLCRKFPEIMFHTNGKKDKVQSLKKIENLYIHYDNWINRKLNAVLKRVYKKQDLLLKYRSRHCKGIIYIGGSLYIQPQDKWLKDYYLNSDRLSIKGKSFNLIGANFGPYKDESFLNHFKDKFKEYEYVCFRDKKTYRLFQDLENVNYAPDIIFQIRDWFPNKKINKKDNEKNKYILFSLVGENVIKNYEEYIEQVNIWVKEYLNRDFNIILLSMCKEQGDLETCNNIKKLNGDCDRIKIVSYENDVEKILEYIYYAEYVVGTRFHSIVISLALNISVFPIIYSNKTINMLKDIDFKGKYIDSNEISKIGFAWVDYNRCNKNDVNSDELAHEAQKHFKWIQNNLNR